MTVMDRVAAEVLSELTEKQVEVLDLLLQHKTTKQIARELRIAPNTVDARIAAVRQKWGTVDRNATARVYSHLLEDCEKTPCGFSPLESDVLPEQPSIRDLPGSPVFALSDAQLQGHWAGQPGRGSVLEALDARFGKAGRVGAILGLAMILAITLVAALAIADALDKLV